MTKNLVPLRVVKGGETLDEKIAFARGQYNAISDLYEYYNKTKFNMYLRQLMGMYSEKIKELESLKSNQ